MAHAPGVTSENLIADYIYAYGVRRDLCLFVGSIRRGRSWGKVITDGPTRGS